jgi:hypothetical protein
MILPRFIKTRAFALASLLVLFGIMETVYLVAEYREAGAFGFGLDDSWIHATFARNLAEGKGFSFNQGEQISGSTAPLFTVALAAWYKLFGEMIWGAKLLGLFGFALACLLLFFAVERLTQNRFAAWYAAALCVVSAPLLISSLSGMELGLYLISPCAALYFFARQQYRNMVVALAMGVWFRPEAVLLLGLGWLAVPQRRKISALFLGVAILLPYFTLNYWLSGYPFPITVRTKSAVYEGHFTSAFLSESATMFSRTHFYPVLLMAPFGFLVLWKRAWWAAAFPVAFFVIIWATSSIPGNFGRYLYPTLPFVYMLSALAILWFSNRHSRSIKPTVLRSIALVILAIQGGVGVGSARLHGLSVENIQDMQVAIAKVVPQITAPSDTIAANDVGALGYYSDRYVLDMEGLITPQRTFEDNLRLSRPALLIIFDTWYPQRMESPTFAEHFESLCRVELKDNFACGGRVMSLYARDDKYDEMNGKLSRLRLSNNWLR